MNLAPSTWLVPWMAAGFIALPLCARADEVLLPIVVHDKWGFIDTTGKVVIEPRFDAVGRFSEGLAAVQEKREWSFIDRSGARVFTVEGEPRGAFHEGRARVCFDRGYLQPYACGAIDRSGKWVWKPHDEKQIAGDFRSGRAQFQDGPINWGYLDSDGKEVVPPIYRSAFQFSERVGVVPVSGGFRFLELDGSVRFFLPAAAARPPHGGLAAFGRVAEHHHVLWGFIAAEGGIVVPPRYLEVGDFAGGRATFRNRDGHWGYLAFDGHVAIAPRFRVALDFAEGLAAASEQGHDGWCAPPTPEPECPREGKHRFGYIDPKGKWVIRPAFDAAEAFEGGAARVTVDGRWRYINKTGATIWPPPPAPMAAPAPAAQVVATGDDLAGKSSGELRRLRNEVYARHGRVFKDPALVEYFTAQPWYKPDPSFSESQLTDEDRVRLELIRAAEKKAAP